jgi:hypothetical protein
LWPRRHPLEEITNQGVVKFYTGAAAVRARLPRPGVPLILKTRRPGGTDLSAQPHGESGAEARRQVRVAFDLYSRRLPAWGKTELEEAELTTGQGKALSGLPHRSGLWRVCQSDHGTGLGRYSQAPCPYSCERTGHIILANEQGTSFSNGGQNAIQNEAAEGEVAIA